MAMPPASRLPGILAESAKPIVADWLASLGPSSDARVPTAELETQCENIVSTLAQACHDGNLTDVDGTSFAPLRDILNDSSQARAHQGFSPTEAATFLLSLKQPLFARPRTVLASEPERLDDEILTIGDLMDALGLFMMETFQRAREEVIIRQQTEIMYSGGLATSWPPESHPALFALDPLLIASVLYRDHARGRDDASVVVWKG